MASKKRKIRDHPRHERMLEHEEEVCKLVGLRVGFSHGEVTVEKVQDAC